MAHLLFRRILGALAILLGVAILIWAVYSLVSPPPGSRSNFRSLARLLVPFALIAVGWTWLRYEGKGIDEITPPDLKCPELEASVVKARATLSSFLPHVEDGGDDAFIKFPLKTPGGNTEHIWGYVHFIKDGRFNVSLANRPFDDKESPDGRRNVPQEEIEDWQIVEPDGRIRGAQSLIALFRYHENRGVKLSPKMKKQKASLIDAGLS